MKQESRLASTKAGRYSVPGLERGLRILEYLDQHPGGRSMVQISQDLGLPKNSVFRITLTLLKAGYLERDPDSARVGLSRKLLSLGYGALAEAPSLVEHSLGFMRQLRDLVRETVCLSVIVEDEGFVLEQVPGLHPFRCVVDPGMRQPLHASASCRAMLAYVPQDELEAILARLPMPRLTPHTLTQATPLRDDLRRVRQRGYALDRGEHIEGVVCVAAPVFDRHAYPVASLTVTGPAGRMPEPQSAELGSQVRTHADRISSGLGCGAILDR
jgi:DNA-binding IclR family transcriptional regulator